MAQELDKDFLELKKHADSLSQLLADPHPGLATWLMAVRGRLHALATLYRDGGGKL